MSPLESAFERREFDVIFTATMTAYKETRFVKQLGCPNHLAYSLRGDIGILTTFCYC
jgi:hypothetical protein